MLINNVEVNTGDCIIACATEPGGYHFTLGFAFKVGDVIDGKTRCVFHDISFDDFFIRDYLEFYEFGDLSIPLAYDIYIVTEKAMNQYISGVQQMEDPSENDVWNCFEEANKNAIKIIQKYRD
jgi:hypothetical protein